VIAEALEFGSKEARRSAEGLCDEIGRMLVSMMKKLKK